MAKPSDSPKADSSGDAGLSSRKAAHISICTDTSQPVEGGTSMFGGVSFLHRSLPEISFDRIDTEADFLGYRLSAPILISCMTGGSAEGYRLNRILAETAQLRGFAVGTGSLRILINRPEVTEHFRLKDIAPDVPVLGNIGAVQLPGLFADRGNGPASELKRFFEILRDLKLDALVIHLNPGQELFQQNGDRDFADLLIHIKRTCELSPFPIIVKETGAGIAPDEAASLFAAGVSYVDIAGSGGTNWMTVEALRESVPGEHATELAGFADWGIPTALSLSALCGGRPASGAANSAALPAGSGDSAARARVSGYGGIIASGGLREPQDFAKALAMGADLVAAALPFIRAADAGGLAGCLEYSDSLLKGIRRTMLLTGARSIPELQQVPLMYSRDFIDRRDQLIQASQSAAAQRADRSGAGSAPGSGEAVAGHSPEGPSASRTGTPGGTENVLADRQFRKRSIHQRRELLAADRALSLDPGDFAAGTSDPDILDLADVMVESAIGVMPVPLGIARNFLIDGRTVHIPMAVEEPSVIAAASFAGGIISRAGGFTTRTDEPLMSGYVYLQIPGIQAAGSAPAVEIDPGAAPAGGAGASYSRSARPPAESASGAAGTPPAAEPTRPHSQPDGDELCRRIIDAEDAIRAELSELLAPMTARGGGYRGLEATTLPGSGVIRCELIIDVRDAMGANLVNSAAEAVSPLLEKITGGTKLMAILSNQGEKRLASAAFSLPLDSLSRGRYRGRELAERIVALCRIADEDPARAVTHNKGIMNGISSLTLATVNDTRAVEAAAHAWAARTGSYRSLSSFRIEDNMLIGELQLPLTLGTVGGGVSFHPTARTAMNILGNPDARRLAAIAASLGLAQNFAALSALAGEGIQQGHMRLHASRLAYSAGARGDELPALISAISDSGRYNVEKARKLLADLRSSGGDKK